MERVMVTFDATPDYYQGASSSSTVILSFADKARCPIRFSSFPLFSHSNKQLDD